MKRFEGHHANQGVVYNLLVLAERRKSPGLCISLLIALLAELEVEYAATSSVVQYVDQPEQGEQATVVNISLHKSSVTFQCHSQLTFSEVYYPPDLHFSSLCWLPF